MLANGITLGYKPTPETVDFTVLTGLKEVPDLGITPEKVENTTLADNVKKYENGIGDAGDLDYKFKYITGATESYRILKALEEAKTVVIFEETLPDGTKFEFSGQISLKLGGGTINNVVDFTLSVALQSEFDITYSA